MARVSYFRLQSVKYKGYFANGTVIKDLANGTAQK